MAGPARSILGDGRLHLHHGPIDLVIAANGTPAAIITAYGRAWERFQTVLDELVAELHQLRAVSNTIPAAFDGAIAQRMAAAAAPFADRFVTPMAAVAGAVADEICAATANGDSLSKVYVNNGGDIAFHLGAGESFQVGLIPDVAHPEALGKAQVDFSEPVRGIATSGHGGRSFSLGVADAVTVLAPTAATADVAATLIANAVDLPGHDAILRRPARDLDPDSDLGDRLVTVDVGLLTSEEIAQALRAGGSLAESYQASGLIAGAALMLKEQVRLIGVQ